MWQWLLWLRMFGARTWTTGLRAGPGAFSSARGSNLLPPPHLPYSFNLLLSSKPHRRVPRVLAASPVMTARPRLGLSRSSAPFCQDFLPSVEVTLVSPGTQQPEVLSEPGHQTLQETAVLLSNKDSHTEGLWSLTPGVGTRSGGPRGEGADSHGCWPEGHLGSC